MRPQGRLMLPSILRSPALCSGASVAWRQLRLWCADVIRETSARKVGCENEGRGEGCHSTLDRSDFSRAIDSPRLYGGPELQEARRCGAAHMDKSAYDASQRHR